MEYKFSKILDLAQRAFGPGKGKEMKPIKWLVSAEELHKFMCLVLEDNGVIEKEEKKVKKISSFLKPKKIGRKLKRNKT